MPRRGSGGSAARYQSWLRRLVLTAAAVTASLAFGASPASAGYGKTYFVGDLSPGQVACSCGYNYWLFNTMSPDSGSEATGIFFNRSNGSWYGTVNGYGELRVYVSGSDYGKANCWNRFAYITYFVNFCYTSSCVNGFC
jgi:hypothetical protein